MHSVISTFEAPDEVRPGLEAWIMGNLDLLPAWVVQLHVSYDKDLECLAQMRPLVEYRRAALAIGPGWLDASDAYRRRTIVHEMMHVQLAPIHIFAANLVTLAGKQHEILDERLREDLRIALEQTTSDLEHLALRLLERADDDDEAARTTAALQEPSILGLEGPSTPQTTREAAP